MVPKEENDDSVPAIALATLVKIVAGIGPSALKALSDLRNPINKNKVDAAAKKIQDGIDSAKTLANTLGAYSDLNASVSTFEDSVINIEFGICGKEQERVSAQTSREVAGVASNFASISEFPLDSLADKVKISQFDRSIRMISNDLAQASTASDNLKLEGNLNDILKETKLILANTFYASRALQKSLTEAGKKPS